MNRLLNVILGEVVITYQIKFMTLKEIIEEIIQIIQKKMREIPTNIIITILK